MTDLKAPHAPRIDAQVPAAPLVYPVYREEDTISLLELASCFYAERYLVMALVGLATLLAFGLTLAMTPLYRAEVLLAPVSQDGNEGMPALIGQLGGLAALVGSFAGPTTDRTAESIATLRSRSLALDFIRAHDLKRQLFAERWDAAHKAWRAPAEAPSDLEAYRLFDRSVRRVNVERGTGLVTLVVEWSDPQVAARWANRLVAEVNARQRADVIREARESIEYFRRQLGEISSIEVRQAIYRLIESQTKTIALASAREEYAFKVIDPAIAPEEPAAPRRLRIVLAGFCLGIVLAVAVVLTKRAIRSWRAALEPSA